MTFMRKLSLFLVSLLLFSGCNSVSNSLKPEAEKLREALRTYEVTLRWGELADVYGFLTPELKERTPIPAGLENIEVTDYEVLMPPRVNDRKAQQKVRIRYIHQDRQIVRSLIDHQLWTNSGEKGWIRANPIPFFK